MTLQEVVYAVNISVWLVLAVMCLPGLIRLFRKKISPLDPLKSALFFVSIAQLDLHLLRSYNKVSLYQYTNVPIWTIGTIALILTVVTLIIVLRKTDKALSHFDGEE